MKIKWNGHACFTITLDSGKTIVTDPFDPEVGYDCPTDRADLITISHSHHDHNYTNTLTGEKHMLFEAGEYRFDDLTITAIQSWHDEVQGQKRGNNLLFKIEADGKTVVHLGDLGHLPTEAQAEFLKNADVMLIPIGGTYTITTQDAIAIIERTQPRCAIPMHFKTPVMNFPITDESEFTACMNAVYAKTQEIEVKNLPKALILEYK